MPDLARRIADHLRSPSGTEPLVLRRAFEPCTELAARLAALVSSGALAGPQVKAFRIDGGSDPWAGSGLPSPQARRHPDAAEVEAAIAGGAVVRVMNAEDLAPTAEAIVRALGAELPVALRGSVLWVPSSGARSQPIHRDGFDALAFQFEGSKRWWIGPPSDLGSLPVDEATGNDRTDPEAAPPDLDRYEVVDLRPGDVLAVPRGRWHLAASGPAGSVHLGIPVLPRRVREALVWVASASTSPIPSNPQGGDRSPLVQIDDELIERLIRETAVDELPPLVDAQELGLPCQQPTADARSGYPTPPFVAAPIVEALRRRTEAGMQVHVGAIDAPGRVLDLAELPWAMRANRLAGPRCFLAGPTVIDAATYHGEWVRAGVRVRAVDLPSMAPLVRSGASLVIGDADRIGLGLDEVCADLEYGLGESVSCNLVVHPAAAIDPLAPRSAEEDALIVQLEGWQRWRTWPGADPRSAPSEIELAPGDALQLPAGTRYQMLRGGPSVHVGMRLVAIREQDLRTWAISQRIEEIEARTALPYDRASWADTIRDEVERSLAHLDGDGRSRAIVDLDHERGLRQVLSLGDRDFGSPGKVLVVQPLRRPSVVTDGEAAVIEGGGRRWTLDGGAASLAQRLVGARWIDAADLAAEDHEAAGLLIEVGFAALSTWPARWGCLGG